jgi:hypothetical protein
MPIGVVTVRILQPGELAEQLLANAGARLQTSSVRELNGQVAEFWLDNATHEEAYEAVQGALDAVGGDWTEFLELRRPSPPSV